VSDIAERNRIEDFLVAFNTVEAELKRRTGLERHEGFKAVARVYVEEKPWWRRDYEAAIAFSELRNVIVHERFKRFDYLSVPSADVVTEMQALRDRLLAPRTAFDEFRRSPVVTVESETSLKELLEQVASNDFTQFPVYEQGKFVGLVTSNGVNRWLAEHVQGFSLVEFESHFVGEILQSEEERENWTFVRGVAPVAEVAFAFRENPQLEAALVTQNGRKTEALLGMATRWDIASLRLG
jgi:predicted transcriptional regulator